MENCMVEVTIYKTSVPYYTEHLDVSNSFFDENMMEVEFPRSIVEDWYDQYPEDFEGDSFDDWFSNYYTADDTDGLFQFAVDRGFHPQIPKLTKYTVELTATYEVYAFDEQSAADEAERQHDIGDYYVYVNGKSFS